jgi:hypothetical protein
MLKSILKNNIAGSMTVKFSDEDVKRLSLKQIMTSPESYEKPRERASSFGSTSNKLPFTNI